MHIIVGSMNGIKLEAAQELSRYHKFSYAQVEADSGVTHQPMTEKETERGAINRAKDALAKDKEADYGLGIEGGVRDDGTTMWCFGCCAIAAKDGRIGVGFSAEFALPPAIRDGVLAGEELGDVTDAFFRRHDTKHKEGAVGVLSDNAITRTEFYRPAVIFAYLRFLKPELYEATR